VRAGTIRLDDDSFVKDGAPVHFRRVRRGASGQAVESSTFTVAAEVRKAKRTKRASKSTAGRGREGRRKPRTSEANPKRARTPLPADANELFEALREWRLAEAKRAGIPAFRVVNDRTLLGVATATPVDEDELLGVPGIGPGLARRYGAAILRIVGRIAGRHGPG
jgi:superfamily II DNA helicase RecQ